jgi:pimeloyl-ACP methyl ester carboxylesterase
VSFHQGLYAVWVNTGGSIVDALKENILRTVTSKDGTLIAFDQVGQGPALIPVPGAFGVRAMATELVVLLAPHFTVFNYDRRGRGDSGDTLPYAVEREIEDIDTLIDAAGGSAFLYGLSSGAILVLDAAEKLSNKVKKLALYEPPLIVDGSHPPLPKDYVAKINEAIGEGRRGDAVEIFMTLVLGIPAEFVAHMRDAPRGENSGEGITTSEWAELEKVAHTLAYDGTIQGDFMLGKPLPAEQWSFVTMPTLVITGEKTEPFFHSGAKALVGVLPHAHHRILQGQAHAVDPKALAPVLIEFFAD